MQLLDSLSLPTAQFASLSILFQLYHQDFSPTDDKSREQHDVTTPTLHQCHSITTDKPKFVPLYQVNSKVLYTDQSDDETIVKEATVLKVHYDDLLEPYYTILIDGREKQTNNSQLSLPNDKEADVSAGLQRKLCRSVLRHDLTTLSPFCLLNENDMQIALESLQYKIMDERGMHDDFMQVNRGNVDEVLDVPTPTNSEATKGSASKAEDDSSSKRKGVSFHQDTKAGKEENETIPGSVDEGKKNSDGGILPMRVYRPPMQHCLALNLYYVQIDIEDVQQSNEKATIFKHVMSVLLPDISLASLKSIGKQKQSGTILLTVAVTGPPYDIYGSSSLMLNLPNRLHEAMSMLTAVDTTPRKEEITLPKQEEGAKLKKSKSSKMAFTHFNKNEEIQPSQQRVTTAVYDSPYFQRLFMALLATIIDDEDGCLRDYDVVSSNKAVAPIQSSTPRVKDVKSKNKRFTFSRRSNKTKYQSGHTIDGDVPLEIADPKDSVSQNAEIVRKTALQIEILSLAEDEMSLPKYNVQKPKRMVSNPKSPKATPLNTTSGRFGRKETQFDLAGFEYRLQPPGSVAGTASTMTSSDDISTNTGDETATLSSKYSFMSIASSVPTLSKSKKDSAVRSSRFKFLQKRKDKATKAKPKPVPEENQMPIQEVFDPFSYEGDVGDLNFDDEQDYRIEETSEADSIASGSTKETPPQAPPIGNAISRSFSEDESEGVPALAPASPVPPTEEEVNMTEAEYEEENAPFRYLEVDLALNEDLTCEYKKSKLSSITVDGTVQVRVKSHREESQPNEETQLPIPFFLMFQDHSRHIKSVQENKKFVEHADLESAAREYTYSITVPRENEYFPVVRYKCSNSLRPVPIRVQSRVRTQGNSCRVALQISSNPQNPSDLVHLTIIMGVPKGVVKGNSLQCNPPGGTYNEHKSVVLWCVSELGGGEKFQLQAMFELEDEYLNMSDDAELVSKLEFPVLARCQCSGAQLSDIVLEVMDIADHYPAEISRNVVRRFRVSHKEK